MKLAAFIVLLIMILDNAHYRKVENLNGITR